MLLIAYRFTFVNIYGQVNTIASVKQPPVVNLGSKRGIRAYAER
mgnify:FL=1